jgi:DNA-binding response OmpR family regulator
MLTMLSHHMRRYSFIIYTAKTTQRAEAVAREKRPHLIVIAETLAGVSTLPLCTLLRQLKGVATIPLIMLATLASKEALAGLPAGVVTETIRLPLTPAAIVDQIRAVYRVHRPPFASEVLVFNDLVSCTLPHVR